MREVDTAELGGMVSVEYSIMHHQLVIVEERDTDNEKAIYIDLKMWRELREFAHNHGWD